MQLRFSGIDRQKINTFYRVARLLLQVCSLRYFVVTSIGVTKQSLKLVESGGQLSHDIIALLCLPYYFSGDRLSVIIALLFTFVYICILLIFMLKGTSVKSVSCTLSESTPLI